MSNKKRDQKLWELWRHAVRSQPGSIAGTLALLHMNSVNMRLWKQIQPAMKYRIKAQLRLARRRGRVAQAAVKRHEVMSERVQIINERNRIDALRRLVKARDEYERSERKIRALKAKVHGVMKEGNGEVDIVADIRWVYSNIGELIQTTPEGIRVINRLKLQTAPSPGAVALTEYACDDMKAFFDKFVIRLFPKDVKHKARTKTSEDRLKELDPGFTDLEEYFQDTEEEEEDSEGNQ